MDATCCTALSLLAGFHCTQTARGTLARTVSAASVGQFLKDKHTMKPIISLYRQWLANLAVTAGLLLLSWSAYADVTFLGVAAGDATSTDAILWTRAVDTNAPSPTALIAQVAANDPSVTAGVVSFSVTTDASKDYTAKI